jgi:hypothetical protein
VPLLPQERPSDDGEGLPNLTDDLRTLEKVFRIQRTTFGRTKRSSEFSG